MILRPLAVAALAAAVCACATNRPPGATPEAAKTPLDQFAVRPVEGVEMVRLAVHAQGLSPSQSAALAGYMQAWRDGAGPTIRVEAPTNGPDAAASHRMGESARAFLISQGAPAAKVHLTGYDARGRADAPLVISYPRHTVELPRCGESWNNLSHTMNNRASANFGCAVSANIAAQLADPGDLLGPRASDPGDAARRIMLLEHYRAGTRPAAGDDESERGTVAEVVK